MIKRFPCPGCGHLICKCWRCPHCGLGRPHAKTPAAVLWYWISAFGGIIAAVAIMNWISQ